MKKLSLFVLAIGLIISLSVYALTSTETDKETFVTQVISGNVKDVASVESAIQGWIRYSPEYRISAISITALPCGQPKDPCGVAYIASFEKRNP